MKEIIWSAVGIVLMIASLVNLIGLLRLKKRGITVLAEVMEVSEIIRGRKKQVSGYTHKLRYEVSGKTIETNDKAGYTQPFAVGSKQLIVADPEKPERFEYEDGLKKSITLFAVMLGVTLIFTGRFILALL